MCRFCRRGNKVFKIELNDYDANRKLTVNAIDLLHKFSFQCEFCCGVSTLDFDKICCPSIIVQLTREKAKKDKINFYKN